MSTQHMAWKHLFIHPADEHYSVERHVVGPSPCLPLLEVAVPFHTQPHLPYQAMPHVPRVSIDLLVTAKETNELGYEGAWKKHQEIFLERAREGISLHGTGLGDWYRSRYPNLRSRIEYLILLQDLPCLPRSWAADLKGADKKSFNALVTEGAVLLNQAIHPGKSQQLFVIWSYTRTRCELGIRQHYKRVFLEATQSILARRTTSTELIVDTMVLFCLTKIAKISSGTKRPSSDILGQFNSVLTRGSLGDDSICLWRCLMSIRRVLSAWDFPGRNPRLVSFINQLKLPDLMPEGSEFVIDHYWSYRFLWKISHPEALDRARKQSGFFPINLPPLKLPEVRNLKADPESEEDCITCTTGYSSCSSYLVYTIIRWELLFSLDNSPTMAIHCRAILILFITSPMTATLLVVMFQRLQDDDGVFPPLVEQIFSDFRFTTHSVLRILCSNADNKPRVDNKPGVVGKV
ncbi:unnamed protein product [Fusarium langsethiae]|nr:unnamed protein product [Fusarium langsethiae]